MSADTTMREVVTTVKTQYEMQLAFIMNELAQLPVNSYEHGILYQNAMSMVEKLALLDSLLVYNNPEVIIHLRAGWVASVEGLPSGIRYVVVEDDGNVQQNKIARGRKS